MLAMDAGTDCLAEKEGARQRRSGFAHVASKKKVL